MEKFDKLKIFETLGFMQQKFDGSKFKKSTSLYVKSFFILFFTILVPFKFFISIFFEREDIRQFYIGSFYNFLPLISRWFMAIVGMLNLFIKID